MSGTCPPFLKNQGAFRRAKRQSRAHFVYFLFWCSTIIQFRYSLYRHRLFNLFLQSVLDEGIDRDAFLKGKHGNLTVDGRGEPHVQHTCIALVGFDALVLAIGQIVVNGLVERSRQFLDALAI